MKTLIFFPTLLVIFALFKGSSSSSDDTCSSVITNPDIIRLETLNGNVRGECWVTPLYLSENTTIEAEVLIWLNIPYAEPPINENRFKKTLPVRSWETEIDGTQWANSCPQTGYEDYGGTSEDCLYLNIYTLASSYLNRTRALKPILIYVHGGSFLSGDGSFDVSQLTAMNDMIVVTLNYRLNALGFLHMPGTEATGNQGITVLLIYSDSERPNGLRQLDVTLLLEYSITILDSEKSFLV